MYKKNILTVDSAPVAVYTLWLEGYFKNWADRKKVSTHLSKRGSNFPEHNLRMALARAKFLTPRKNGIIIEYIQKKVPTSQDVNKIKSGSNKTGIKALAIDFEYLHGDIKRVTRSLFDHQHYPQAVFEAYKMVVNKVKTISGIHDKDGKSLMEFVFSLNNPIIKLNSLISTSDKDEQLGFMFLFSGAAVGIRNPKAHDFPKLKNPQRALMYLSFASLLLTRLDERIKPPQLRWFY